MTGRRWFRWILRLLLALVVLVLAAALGLRLYGQYRLAQARKLADQVFAGITWESCAPPAVAGSDDATPLLQAGAVAWMVVGDDRSFLERLSTRLGSTWSPEERQRARSLFAKESAALELFHRAGELLFPAGSLFGGPDDQAGDRILLGFIRSARLLAVHSQLAWQAGDHCQSWRSLKALAQLSASLQHTNTVIGLILGVGAERLLHLALHPLLEDPAISADWLGKIAALVPRDDISHRWRCVLLRERTRLYRDFGQFGFHIAGPHWEAGFLNLLAKLAGVMETPFGHHPGWIPTPPLWRDGPAATFTAPNLISAGARLQHLAASRQLLLTALALRLQALTTGAYPPSLVDLPGANRPDLFTGKPFQYAIEDDGSANLSSPDMAELYKYVRLSGGGPRVTPTSWHLPPPQPPPSAPGGTSHVSQTSEGWRSRRQASLPCPPSSTLVSP